MRLEIMYKEDLTLNNLQWLICHKTQPNQTNVFYGISTLIGYLILNTVSTYILHMHDL